MLVIDKARFQKLYDEHHSGVKNYFRYKGFPMEDAEDLTQEVFLSVFKHRANFEGRSSFRGWLNIISANTWKNKIRELHSLKRDALVVSLDTAQVESEHLHEEPNHHPLQQTIHHQHRELLWQAVSDLPETVHACVVLRVYDELSYQEIATVLQIHYETVKSRLHQAQGKLKQALSKHIHVDFLERER